MKLKEVANTDISELISLDTQQVIRLLMQAACWVALAGVPLYYYPQLDAWWFKASGGKAFFMGLAMYNADGFGVIHIPSIMLAILLALAAMLTPWLVDNMLRLVDRFVLQVQATRVAKVTD